MIDNSLISIIIPVYNVEPYLRRCLDSVVNQTYKNLEIILVDDGSTDKSGEICEEYKKKDKRIIVIHQKNQGVSVARNTGLDIFKGEYVSFVDSDDYVDLRFIEILHSNIIKSGADISVCSIIAVDKDNNEEIYEKLKNNQYRDIDYFGATLTVACWNKIYKKNIFKNIRFPVDKYAEDTYIYFDLINFSKLIVTCEDLLYYYVQHNNSITANNYIKHRIEGFEARKNVLLAIYYRGCDKFAINKWFIFLYDWYVYCLKLFRQKIAVEEIKLLKLYFFEIKKIKAKLYFANRLKLRFPILYAKISRGINCFKKLFKKN